MQGKTIILDFDGTLVENKWPDIGDWMPGAIKAVTRLHDAGFKLMVFSARLSPVDPFTHEDRNPADVITEIQRVRNKLDSAGLTYIDIWTKPGKPGGWLYIDDRGERYHGRATSWDKLTDKVLMRAGEEVEV